MASFNRLITGALLATTTLAAPVALAQNDSVVTEPPNVPSQEPAFEDQTRAPQPENPISVSTETVAEGLPQLWSMEFLPDGNMLVAAKAGAMHIVSPEGEVGPALGNVPAVMSEGQGGLLDIALAPDFEQSREIFFSFAEPREDGNGTSVSSATLSRDGDLGGSLEDVALIFQQMPSYDGTMHFGSRLVFSPEGNLFVTVGERSDTPIRDHAQDLTQGQGKIFRITPEGEAVEDNPYTGHAAIQPEIWTWGHRNLQSATLGGDGNLWTVEHGPAGGDELNHPQYGRNYGWPAITYGEDYPGTPIGNGRTEQVGMEQPVYYWDPVIAPSGMAYYEGDEFASLDNAFIIGGLVTQGLVIVHLEDGRVAYEERVPMDARIRDVRVGPDGAIYAVTENRSDSSSTIVRVTNAN